MWKEWKNKKRPGLAHLKKFKFQLSFAIYFPSFGMIIFDRSTPLNDLSQHFMISVVPTLRCRRCGADVALPTLRCRRCVADVAVGPGAGVVKLLLTSPLHTLEDEQRLMCRWWNYPFRRSTRLIQSYGQVKGQNPNWYPVANRIKSPSMIILNDSYT